MAGERVEVSQAAGPLKSSAGAVEAPSEGMMGPQRTLTQTWAVRLPPEVTCTEAPGMKWGQLNEGDTEQEEESTHAKALRQE